nr:hypothetical protein [Halomicroarcula rubra]
MEVNSLLKQFVGNPRDFFVTYRSLLFEELGVPWEVSKLEVDVIADRRNELSGNISLNQELGFIERLNGCVEDGTLPADKF